MPCTNVDSDRSAPASNAAAPWRSSAVRMPAAYATRQMSPLGDDRGRQTLMLLQRLSAAVRSRPHPLATASRPRPHGGRTIAAAQAVVDAPAGSAPSPRTRPRSRSRQRGRGRTRAWAAPALMPLWWPQRTGCRCCSPRPDGRERQMRRTRWSAPKPSGTSRWPCRRCCSSSTRSAPVRRARRCRKSHSSPENAGGADGTATARSTLTNRRSSSWRPHWSCYASKARTGRSSGGSTAGICRRCGM